MSLGVEVNANLGVAAYLDEEAWLDEDAILGVEEAAKLRNGDLVLLCASCAWVCGRLKTGCRCTNTGCGGGLGLRAGGEGESEGETCEGEEGDWMTILGPSGGGVAAGWTRESSLALKSK